MVASLTPWCRAIPAAVLRPDSTSSTTAARCCPVSFGRRPGLRPAARATAGPAAVRPLRLPRSSPARPPIIPAAAWPSGVVVSSASLRLRRPAPAAATCCMRRTTSGRDRPRHANAGTTTTSPGCKASSTLRNSGCSRRRPAARSSTTRSQPASASARRWAASTSPPSAPPRR